MDQFGIDRNRTYTREEICRRYGYTAESSDDVRNLNRFFSRNFLKRGLLAVPVGKTFEVSGELYFAWTMANSRPCLDDDAKVQTG